MIQWNSRYKRTTGKSNKDIVELVENELIRIENDPALKHLLGGNEEEQA